MIEGPFSALLAAGDARADEVQVLLAQRRLRRRVSVECALPPSMIMSPGSSSGANSSITASVAGPALTIMSRCLGRSSEATNSPAVWAARNGPSWPNCVTMPVTRDTVRLCRATDVRRQPRLDLPHLAAESE
jgi:hypothetical protein